MDALIIIAPETVHQQTGQELGFLAHPSEDLGGCFKRQSLTMKQMLHTMMIHDLTGLTMEHWSHWACSDVDVSLANSQKLAK